VPAVNGWITHEQTQQRYAQINQFERLLTETGTVICKFMLHISKDAQRVRLQERLDDPTKHWKFAAGDLEVRKQWERLSAGLHRRDSPRPARPGRRGRSCRPTRRPTAT